MSWRVDLGFAQGGAAFRWTLTTDARWVGLFGPSGLGKTTLVEALLGWRAAGRGPSGALDAGPVGYLPQDVLLMPHWSVAEQLARLVPGPAVAGLGRDVVVETLGIGHLMERRSAELSGGEARRVGLARALLRAGATGTLVLDEPLSALDPERRVEVLGLLLALKARTTVRAVVVSHAADELALLTDVVQVLPASHADGTCQPSAPAEPNRALAAAGLHENRLAARVVALQGDAARVLVLGEAQRVLKASDAGELPQSAATEIVVPSAGLAVGDVGIFGLRGDDVLLGLDDPGRVSARNKLSGTVAALEPAGGYVNLFVDVAGTPLSTHLTRAAVADLELEVGAPVRLFFKTRSVRLLARLA